MTADGDEPRFVTARVGAWWSGQLGRRIRAVTLRQWKHREPELRTKRVAGVTLYNLDDVQRYAKEGPWSALLDMEASRRDPEAGSSVGDQLPDGTHIHGDSCPGGCDD